MTSPSNSQLGASISVNNEDLSLSGVSPGEDKNSLDPMTSMSGYHSDLPSRAKREDFSTPGESDHLSSSKAYMGMGIGQLEPSIIGFAEAPANTQCQGDRIAGVSEIDTAVPLSNKSDLSKMSENE